MKANHLLVAFLGLSMSAAVLAQDAADSQAISAEGSNEVLVTQSAAKGKGGKTFALDFVSDGNAIAFEFTLAFPQGTDLSKLAMGDCISQLPSTHTGKCIANEKTGELLVIVYSPNNARLAPGIVSVGEVGISSMAKGLPTVVKALAVDAQNNERSIAGRLD